MGFCKNCEKYIKQTEGRRKKEYCNNTCRSNFWYGKNKKGQPIVAAPPQKVYDAPKLPDNFTHDEPLSFDRLKQEAAPQPQMRLPKTVAQYMTWKREIQNEEEYQEFCRDVEANYILNRKQKDFCKTANPSQL
jgi:hypothetical protein